MPSKTPKQERFMRMAAHKEGQEWCEKKHVKCPPMSVAKEFSKADELRKRKSGSHKKDK